MHLKPYIEIHIAVLLFGLTAILGDIIRIPAVSLVWWRVLITSISLLFIINKLKQILQIPKRHLLFLSFIGCLIALHWITFFGSIKASNASITLICMATASFFTSLLEPLIIKKKVNKIEVLYGLLVIPGMIFIVKNLETYQLLGVFLGLISAFLAALFGIFNKTIVNTIEAKQITLIELSSSWLFISLCLPFLPKVWVTPFLPIGTDWLYLIFLAIGCTTLAFVLTLKAMQYLSAFETSLIINLEPVYGIILAFLILNDKDELNNEFYIGVTLILFVVFTFPIIKKKFK